MKLKLENGDHISLKTANGEEMDVKGLSHIFLDMYEGKHERNLPFTRKRIRIIVSNSLDDEEDILLSRNALERLILLPKSWPFRDDSNDSRIITSKLTKEEAEEIIEGLRLGHIERCLKATSTTKKSDKERQELLADRLYSTTGNVKDVPNMAELPEEICQLLWQYEDVFKEKLVQGRTMDIPLVELRIDKSKPVPEQCIHPRPVPAHW